MCSRDAQTTILLEDILLSLSITFKLQIFNAILY